MIDIPLMQIFLKGSIDEDDFRQLSEHNPFFLKRICDYYYIKPSDLRIYILTGDFNVIHLYQAITGIIEGSKNYYPFEFIKMHQDFQISAKKLMDKCQQILNGDKK